MRGALALLCAAALASQCVGFNFGYGRTTYTRARIHVVKMEVFAGNPFGKFVWDAVWKLPLFNKGEPGAPVTFGDSAWVLRSNIEQVYGGELSYDGAPLAEGEVVDLVADGALFLALKGYYDKVSKYYSSVRKPDSCRAHRHVGRQRL
jgi:hypothetical protein